MTKKRLWLSILSLVVIIGVMLGGCAQGPAEPSEPGAPPPPEAKEPFKVGITSAMTGPGAVTYLPLTDGIRIYLEKINDEGGINGREIELFIEDDRAEPSRAVTNAKALIERDGINLLVTSSASSTYSGLVAECEKSNIPLIIAGSGSPKELPPEPHPLMFDSIYNVVFDVTYLIGHLLREYDTGDDVKLGLLGVSIPGAKLATENLGKYCNDIGIETVMEFIDMGVTDLTAVASTLNAADCDYAFFYGPGGYSVLLWNALDKIGWPGTMYVLPSDPFEFAVEPFKGRGERAIFMGLMAPLPLDYPIHREIIATAEKYSVAEINTNLCWGWMGGRMVEAILSRADYPVTTENLLGIMNNLEIDHRPLYGQREWTETDHVGSWAYSRLYEWSDAEETLIPISDWARANSLGTVVENVGPEL